MTDVVAAPDEDEVVVVDDPAGAPPGSPDVDRPPRFDLQRILRATVRWVVIVVATLLIFSAFLVAKGADARDALQAMWDTAFGDANGVGETLIRAVPFLFAALATTVPARARFIPDSTSNGLALLIMGLGGMALGAAWAAIPALLRLFCRTNEAISSLLLNYVAALVVTWLCFEPWKDPTSLGQAYTTELSPNERLPVLWGARVHAGIIVALVVTIAIWILLRSTAWGFKLSVLGGNPEAARRAGLAVGGLSLAAFAVGGALAGLGGAIEVAGVEGRLRPEILAGYGFIGFLASWLGRHHPLKVLAASVLLAAIAVGGSGLRISTGLSGGAVNILMALVLFAVLGFGRPLKKEA
jgi:general nucleoside transport system permease protein